MITDNSYESLQTKLLLIMKKLETWVFNNDLIINITKTEAMSFHLSHSTPTYKPRILLYNNDIKYTSEVKFLGLCIIENLNWHLLLMRQFEQTFFCHQNCKKSFGVHVFWNIYFARFHA